MNVSHDRGGHHQPHGPRLSLISVRAYHSVKLKPHWHPEDRMYTVTSGVFDIGVGDQFDGDKLQAYPPGNVIVPPGKYRAVPQYGAPEVLKYEDFPDPVTWPERSAMANSRYPSPRNCRSETLVKDISQLNRAPGAKSCYSLEPVDGLGSPPRLDRVMALRIPAR
jgi:hypothetical protein